MQIQHFYYIRRILGNCFFSLVYHEEGGKLDLAQDYFLLADATIGK